MARASVLHLSCRHARNTRRHVWKLDARHTFWRPFGHRVWRCRPVPDASQLAASLNQPLIRRRMLHVVEIQIAADNFRELISRLRDWLEDERFQPRTFRYALSDPDTVLRVDFEIEDEAQAFARAFGGVVLG